MVFQIPIFLANFAIFSSKKGGTLLRSKMFQNFS